MTQRKERTMGLSRVWQAVRLLLADGEWHSFERDILPNLGPLVPPERAVRRYLIQKQYGERQSGRVPDEPQYEDMPAEDLSGRDDEERRRRIAVGTRATLHHQVQTYIKKLGGERRGQRGDMEYRLKNGAYQLFPALDPVRYKALKASIAEHGVLTPVLVDEHGSTLDGHNRERICLELGKDYPRHIVRGLTEAQKLEVVISSNEHRRKVSKEDRQEAARRLRARGWTAPVIAEVLGVSDQTVYNDLSNAPPESNDLDSGNEPGRIVASDGKMRPAHYTRRAQREAMQSNDVGEPQPQPEPAYDDVPCPHCGGTGTIRTPRTL